MIKKLLIILFILTTFNLISCEQNDKDTWNLSLGTAELHDVARDVTETRDGAFVAVGYSLTVLYSQLYLAKADAEGNLLWKLNFSGEQETQGFTIKETADQGFILGGSINFKEDKGACITSYGQCSDCLLAKTDRNGHKIWQTHVGSPETDEHLDDVEQTPDGGYLAVGVQTDSETRKILVIRFDAAGNVVFQKNFDADHDIDGPQLHDTGDGNFLVVGEYEDQTTGLFLLRIDQMGNEIWRKVLVDPSVDMDSISAVVLSDGGILAAFNEDRPNEPSAKINIKILRLDAEGNELWSNTIAEQAIYLISYAIDQTDDGGFILTGKHVVDGDRANLLLLKVNSKGDEIWRKIYGGYMSDAGLAVRQAADGGFIVAGLTESYIPGGVELARRMMRNNRSVWDMLVINDPANFWLIKTDAKGNAPLFPQNLTFSDIGLNNRP